MPDIAAVLLAASTFTSYPAFGDGPLRPQPLKPNHARVEVISDKGLIVEMIVACPKGVAIVTFSKVERLYCAPDGACGRDLGDAVQRSCRPRT